MLYALVIKNQKLVLYKRRVLRCISVAVILLPVSHPEHYTNIKDIVAPTQRHKPTRFVLNSEQKKCIWVCWKFQIKKTITCVILFKAYKKMYLWVSRRVVWNKKKIPVGVIHTHHPRLFRYRMLNGISHVLPTVYTSIAHEVTTII